MSNSNSMVAHLWSQRDKKRARSSNGNFSFEGATLYSYSTPIAQFYDVDGGEVCLVTSRRYSVTTSGKHMTALWRALSYDRSNVFVVPNVTPVLIGGREHVENLAHLVAAFDERATYAQRAKQYYGDANDLHGELSDLAEKAERYAKLFELPAPQFDNPAEVARRVFAKRAERDTPEAIAKREKARVKRAERQARIDADREGAWRRGELHTLPRSGYGVPALLRVKGDRLETSQGATVPLADAIRVYKFVKLCRERGEGWQRNGRSLPVGHFSVDAVYPGGDFKAGCHLIQWPEIEQAAIAAGVIDVPAEDTRQERAAA